METTQIVIDGRYQHFVAKFRPQLTVEEAREGATSQHTWLLPYGCETEEAALVAAAHHIAAEGLPVQTPVTIHKTYVRVI
jgi:hypothetical protein